MKRIIAFVLCAMLVFGMAFVAHAEDLPTEEQESTEVENPTEEQSFTETIVGYVQEHFEEISVIVSLLIAAIYEIRKHKSLIGSIGTINNNAVGIAQNSAIYAENVAETLRTYKEEMEAMLVGIKSKYEENANATDLLAEVKKLLTTSKLATAELANEVAELLVLANIPNSKKDELYARHLAAVRALKEAEENDETES